MSYEDQITFVTTAMLRHEIIKRTYSSFDKNLTGIDLGKCKLLLNIDPLPDQNRSKHHYDTVIKIANEYFGEVEFFTPKKANHTKAVKRLWNRVETEYIFHLQDDWALFEEISFPEMMKVFTSHPQKHQVMLMRQCWPRPLRVGFPPSVIDRTFFEGLADLFDDNKACEYQMHQIFLGHKDYPKHPNKLNHNCLYYYPDEKKPVMKDIGRNWMRSSGYIRPKHNKFVTWKKR